MTTKLKLYNKALGFVGTQRLASLTEDVTARYELDAVYDDALQHCLEMGNWKFAIRSARLTYDSDLDPGFGLAYGYTMPSDFVRLANISDDEYFRSEIDDYVEENGYWFTDRAQMYVRWVSNGPSYGLDLGKYPENYARVVACHMAIEAALPISKDRGSRADLINEFQAIILPRAKRLDAIDERVKRKPAGRWSRARFLNGAARVFIRNGRMGGF